MSTRDMSTRDMSTRDMSTPEKFGFWLEDALSIVFPLPGSRLVWGLAGLLLPGLQNALDDLPAVAQMERRQPIAGFRDRVVDAPGQVM
jgi:hypothetical protein